MGLAAPLAGVLLAAPLLLVGCDPYPVPLEPDRAQVSIEAGSGGHVRADMFLSRRLNRPELVRVGSAAADALFPPSARARVSLGNNGAGVPFVIVDAPDAYRPGPRPSFTVDGPALRAVLVAEGLTEISLAVCGARVPVDIAVVPVTLPDGGCVHWERVGPAAPLVTVTMHPSPARYAVPVGLLVLAVLAALGAAAGLRPLALTGWRRARVAALCGVALVLSLPALAVTAARVDNLGVAGVVPRPALTAARLVPLGAMSLIIASVVLGTVALLVGRDAVSRRADRQ